MRETANSKAGRYLTEGRIIIRSVSDGMVTALARGDGAFYEVTGDQDVWACTCPARSLRCSHLLAVRRVVATNTERLRSNPNMEDMENFADPMEVSQ